MFAHGTAFDDYVSAVHIQDTFAVLDRYRIDYTLMESNTPIVHLLRHSPCWREIYRDKVAVIDRRTAAEGSCAPSPPASAESR